MQKLSSATQALLAAVLLTAAVTFAQAPGASLHPATADVYAGYVVNVPDYATLAPVHNLQGYELAVNLHVGNRWGLVASASQTFSGASHAHQFQVTAGPRFDFLTGRFRPYATGQFGVSNQDSDQEHPGVLTAHFSRRNALTYRVGGGADYQLTSRLYWRLGQWTAQPVPWGRHASSLFQNFSTGVGYRF
jgi:opacity protein-like surface antigen